MNNEMNVGSDVVTSEAARLEELWRGDFGNAYTQRNAQAGQGRDTFWNSFLAEFPCSRVLEVGCNVGANLQWLASLIAPQQVYGVDINEGALRELRRGTLATTNTIWCPARELPFRDGWFDLVFTTGVLIHQPETTLPLVMSEIVRSSRRYVLCGEYFSPETVEVSYREQKGALFKRDYGRLYKELFPDLVLKKQGSLGADQGWDDITYWMFEKPQFAIPDSTVPEKQG
jgi:pseudaminic acid biosynthesis-associated methylase